MKKRTKIVVGLFVIAACVGAPAASYAADPQTNQDPHVATLQQLAETQTSTEIAEIMNSSDPAVAYFDWESKTVLSAKRVAPKIEPRAITSVGPGCSSTSACFRTPAPIGYKGSGSIWLNHKANSIAAGDRASNFQAKDGTSVTVRPYVAIELTQYIEFRKLTR